MNIYQKSFNPSDDNYKHCPLCKHVLTISNKHPDYKECTYCHTLFKYKNIVSIENYDAYINIYKNKEKIERELILDYAHYKNIKEVLLKPINSANIDKFAKIISFGGGYPKLEAALGKSDWIIVYDFLADEVYEKYKHMFFEVYKNLITENFKLEYRNTAISADNIANLLLQEAQESADDKMLITFVHILEHLYYQDFIKLLKSLILNVPDDVKERTQFIIYQPNVATANSHTWFHFAAIEHVLFLPIDTYIFVLTQLGFDCLFQQTIHDDLYIFGRLK